MDELIKGRIANLLGWSVHIAVVAAMILYMNYMEIFASIGIMATAVIIPVALLLLLKKLKIIPPDDESSLPFMRWFVYIFGTFAYFLVFYLHLSFGQTVTVFLIGIIGSVLFSLIKKM